MNPEKEENFAARTLKTGGLMAVAVTAVLFSVHLNSWAWGFVIGSALSLFSLVTLAIVVPMLFQPGAPRFMRAVLALTLWMKLPIYCVGLYLATHLAGIQPAAAVLGIGLVPAVMTLKALGQAVVLPARTPKSAPVIETKPRRALRAVFVREEG